MPEFPFSAAILAGGRSSRMGRDKAFLPIDGQPLIARQASLLRSLGTDDLIISGRSDIDYAAPDARIVLDSVPNAGPLTGLIAVLSAARHPWVIIIAVDLPNLDAAFLNRLLTLGGGHTGVVPHGPRGYEPLAALYPSALLPAAEAALQDGHYSLQPLLHEAEHSGVIQRWALDSDELFANWNSLEDLPPTP